MSDKKHNIKSDDEYQFPKDEYLDHSVGMGSEEPLSDLSEEARDFGTQIPKKPSLFERFPMLKNKKVLGGVAIVIVLFVGMQMMHHRSNNKVIMKKAAPVAVATESSEVATKLAGLNAAQTENMSQVQQLKQQVSKLQDALSNSANANVQLNQNVSALTEQVKLLSKMVEQNTHDLTVSKTKGHMAKPISYRIKAVIPGRAWLVSSEGRITTVSVGDHISDYYGSVKLIDSDTGRIITSSGKVITYGKFDH